MTTIKYAFWGTGPLAESVLYALYKNDLAPTLVITKPDSKVGRKQEVISPQIKTWCDLKGIKVYQPETLKENIELQEMLKDFDMSIVASYGEIIPEGILNMPRLGFLNIHPSMLPLYRGPSPIEAQLLTGAKEIGISIMKLDKEMDHGPILIQNMLSINDNDTSHTVEIKSGQAGGELLSQIFESYTSGHLIAKEQDHSIATFCKFVNKADGEVSLKDDVEIIKNKFRAYTPWPGIFFMHAHNKNNIRVKVSDINFEANSIEELIQKVIPEGKSEMTFESFKNGYVAN
jgi:methionyl-tRNA formyltransferase